MEAVPGYLSLHQSAENLTLTWTPNQLINGTLGDSELEKRWGFYTYSKEAGQGVEAWPRAGSGDTQQTPRDKTYSLSQCQELEGEAGCLE